MPITMPRTGEEAGHWAGGLNSVASYIANRPAIVAAARARAAQMQMMQSRGQQYQAQAAILAQKLSDLKVSADDREALADAAQAAAPFLQAGKNDAPEVAKFSGLIAKIAAENKGHPAVEVLTSMGLPQPNAKYTADTRAKATTDAANIRADATKYGADQRVSAELAKAGMNPYTTVTAGGAVVDKRTGKIVAQNPSAAAARGNDNIFDTVTEKVPAEAPVPPVPADPGSDGFLGIGKRTPTPAQPGKPGHGEMTITRKVPRGAAPLSVADAIAATGVNVRPDVGAPAQATDSAESAPFVEQPAPQSAPSSVPAVAAPVKVRVIHPNGTPGFIPATQVDAAFKQGFKLSPEQPAPTALPAASAPAPTDSGD